MITAAQMLSILNEEDFEGLLALNFPEDEYMAEAREIATLLNSAKYDNPDEQVIAKVVMDVWSHMFGPFMHEEKERRAEALASITRKVAAIHLPNRQES